MALEQNEQSHSHQASIRRRKVLAGATVTASIVLAAALAVAVNYIFAYMGGRNLGRKDLQSLGQFGISDRTARVLDQLKPLDQSVRVTVMYTSPDKDTPGKKFGPRVLEYAQELARYSDRVTVQDVVDVEQRYEVVDRLRNTLGERAQAHRQLVKDFQKFLTDSPAVLEREAARWRQQSGAAGLAEFSQLHEQFGALLDQARRTTDDARRDFSDRVDTQGGVPDYGALAGEATRMAGAIQQSLKQIDEVLDAISKSLAALAADDGKQVKDARAAAQQVDSALDALEQALGSANQPSPDDPAPTLTKLADALDQTLKALAAHDQAMTALLRAQPGLGLHQMFSLQTESGQESLPLTMADVQVAAMLRDLAETTRQTIQGQPVHIQKTLLDNVRQEPQLRNYLTLLRRSVRQWPAMLERIANMDAPSRQILQQHGGELAGVIAEAGRIAEAGKALPPLKQGELGQEIKDENVVLIEMGDQVALVDFQSVWPEARRQSSSEDQSLRRVFNGDQAIGGEIFRLLRPRLVRETVAGGASGAIAAASTRPATQPAADDQPALAEVILTYYEQMPPPQYRSQMPGVSGPIPSESLTELTRALEKAGLTVQQWNLAGQMGAPSGDVPPMPEAKSAWLKDQPRKRLLLVLPPPGPEATMQTQSPGFGEQQLQAVSDAIDAGHPAIFLATFHPSRFGPPPSNSVSNYLRQQWDIDVKTGYRLLIGTPDAKQPDKFDLSVFDQMWLPLSSFADHPVGAPLRARQMFWLNACPVLEAAVPEGPDHPAVRVEPILAVEKGVRNLWAESNVQEVAESSLRDVAPGEGDIQAPFPVIVAATRTPKDEAQQRIIVAGIGATFVDDYLMNPVIRLGRNQTIDESGPKPTGALDLLVNACYYLTGNGEYIGAGPTDLGPIRDIRKGDLAMMKWAVAGGLPALVLILGIAVMIGRRY